MILISHRLTNGYCNARREHARERFVIQLSIVHRHFAGVIEFGVVQDDLRIQFCSQSRPGMKHGCLADSAIIRYPNADRHVVGAGLLVAVERDLGFEPGVHQKDENQTSIRCFSQLFFLKFERAVFGIDVHGLAFADFALEDVDT
jgi:hypothetical protein